jgi:hypothetical protein
MARGQRKAELMAVDSSESVQNTNVSLRTEVKEALLNIIRDPDASATAKASASRTLLEYFEDDVIGVGARGADMSAAELDEAIAELSIK